MQILLKCRNPSIEVCFNDGRKGIADLKEALRGPVFKPLKDKSLFAQFSVDPELETISWLNGADLAPDSSSRLSKMSLISRRSSRNEAI